MRDIPTALILSILIFAAACSSSIEETELPETIVIEDGDRILVIDQTGKEWDITHAVTKYGMRAKDWQYGLGPNAIRPILAAEFWEPGERGYPPPDNSEIVIGTTINGDSRAYKIGHLNAHEVVDEMFGNTHVAVGW